ncbi:hypothetical protein [Legionella lansingensis]|uniref:hypothetical protein n=1 Tax=Legionella lansingensis TaxID=45067 RepID=UPI00048E960C|nr:hypothetical protein [Legionella lansingensis]
MKSDNFPWDKLSAIPENGIADKLQKAYQSKFLDNFIALMRMLGKCFMKMIKTLSSAYDLDQISMRFFAHKLEGAFADLVVTGRAVATPR